MGTSQNIEIKHTLAATEFLNFELFLEIAWTSAKPNLKQ